MDLYTIILAVTFFSTLSFILYEKYKASRGVEAQFLVVGSLAIVFYIVCFLSGICTILNFIWKWLI